MRLANKGRDSEMLWFQKGIVQNVRALPLLYDDLVSTFPEEDILIYTYRLNQDCLEVLFSIIRAMGVTVTCPTCVDFCCRISKRLLMKTPTDLLQGLATKLNVDIEAHLPNLAHSVSYYFQA
jgi:hypothetical protein